MLIRSECQALCVAVEMEKRAIRLYERALMLVQDEQVRRAITDILADEQEHLCHFQAMQKCHPLGAGEEQLLLQSMAAETLFPGGVMAMNREQALATLEGLYRHAAENEAHAVETYGEFAQKCENAQVRDAFLRIEKEERGHLAILKAKQGKE